MHPVPAMKTDKPEDNENFDSSIWDSVGNILTISNLKWTLAEAWGLREIIVTGDAHSEFETRLAPGAYSAVPFRARLLRWLLRGKDRSCFESRRSGDGREPGRGPSFRTMPPGSTITRNTLVTIAQHRLPFLDGIEILLVQYSDLRKATRHYFSH
ncbi:hypothetical protein V1477_011246 [Vespula maculifrons]|uniref:Uncharacterized protein n=1 Tax=Vespula maculifrons TaxID=7453 RepID=A0ABD2C494_VESMC